MAGRSVFLSYSREDAAVVAALEADLESVGGDVWRDRLLSGGQDWWNTILQRIRSADVFVTVVSPASVRSLPCARELAYALALGKAVLPVSIGSRLPAGVLPAELASRQVIEYADDKASALRLVRALSDLPLAPALPDPLPAPPAAPLSYTSEIASIVHAPHELTASQQRAALERLRAGLAATQTRDDCVALLEALRRRRDIVADVADAVDDALAGAPPVPADPGAGALRPDDSASSRRAPAALLTAVEPPAAGPSLADPSATGPGAAGPAAPDRRAGGGSAGGPSWRPKHPVATPLLCVTWLVWVATHLLGGNSTEYMSRTFSALVVAVVLVAGLESTWLRGHALWLIVASANSIAMLPLMVSEMDAEAVPHRSRRRGRRRGRPALRRPCRPQTVARPRREQPRRLPRLPRHRLARSGSVEQVAEILNEYGVSGGLRDCGGLRLPRGGRCLRLARPPQPGRRARPFDDAADFLIGALLAAPDRAAPDCAAPGRAAPGRPGDRATAPPTPVSRARSSSSAAR